MTPKTMLSRHQKPIDSSLLTGIMQRKCESCARSTIAGRTCHKCKQQKNSQQSTFRQQKLSNGLPKEGKQTRNHTFSTSRPLPIAALMPQIVQPELKIGAPNDKFEQEADQIADQVMKMPEQNLHFLAYQGKDNEKPLKTQSLIQRQSDSYSSNNITHALVNEAMKSPGKRLDADSQAFMEFRFRNNFSQVRVHTDASAAASAQALNAQAYTLGNNIVFGAGKYQPRTSHGRALLAHELVHVIQQREGLSPQIQCLKVTRGGFGRALEEFTNIHNVPERAIRLLRRSRTFMGLARTLDRHYVPLSETDMLSLAAVTSNGVINGGDPSTPRHMAGKRILIVTGGSAPSFEPYNSPDNILSGDVIVLPDSRTPGFIQHLAHEATHAATFVRAHAPSPQTLVAEVQSGIQEEIQTRQSEATILGEIPGQNIQNAFDPVGSRVPAEVERNVPRAFMLTYLELFFFNRRLRDTQATDGLSDQQAKEIRERVKEADQLGLVYPWMGEYGMVWANRLIAKQEWVEFFQQNQPTSPSFEQRKEALLQDHARRFFNGQVAYRPLP